MQRESLFLRQKTTKEVALFFKNFDSSKIIENVDSDKGNGLIFVLGMPRSGTTLVESIIGTAQDTVVVRKVLFLFNYIK